MGTYLNSVGPYIMYKSECDKPYFVDKSMILQELLPLVKQGNNHVCITRPRRFGKTVMANMIGAFLGKGQYISRIEKRLIVDLQEAYPDCRISDEGAVWDALMQVFSVNGNEKFVFVLDEWDFIFHKVFITEEDKRDYISFLSNLLKDKPYVSLAYMTGILPISKYSSGSELNMFIEFSMVTQQRFSDYFGFTESEVKDLYVKYQKNTSKELRVSLEGLREWYNGYHTASGERVYNPRSVVAALNNNQLANYWTSSGPYDEIFYYIQNNIADIRKDLAIMIAGEAVPAKVQEYAATSMKLRTKDEIFSAMVVYGFLSYENGKVSIPNKELMDRFVDMVQKEVSLGYIYRLAKESERMLAATLSGDVETMAEILEYVHDIETPLLVAADRRF